MKKISTRVLIILFIVGIISAIPTSLVGINTIIQSSKSQAKDFGAKSAYYNATIIKTWMDEKYKLMLNIKEELKDSNDLQNLEQSLYRYSEINKDFISLFVGFEDNSLVDAYGWDPGHDYIVAERPWFIKAIRSDGAVVTSTYKDWNKNENVVALATKVTANNREGVLATNVYADYIEEIIKGIKYGEDGFVYLLDEHKSIMVDSRKSNQLNVQNILEAIARENIDISMDGTHELRIDNTEYIVSIASIDGYDWTLLLAAPLSDFTKNANKMISKYVFIMIMIVLLILYIDYLLSKTISTPINALIKSISDIAKGNFDDKVIIKGNDEISNLGVELDKMRCNLKKIFEKNEYESKILAMNTKYLEEHLNETYKGTYNFMSLLSHDIKTPITLIKGYSKAINMDIIDDKKKELYMERITYRANQIEKIITDILDDTLDVNNINIKLSTLDISDYINMVLYNSEVYVINQEREFVKNISYDMFAEDEYINIDIIKIQRVMNNILSNAVKFSNQESVIELSILRDGDKLVTYFKDYGRGVAESEKDKIFNMFYKSDINNKGYGLGLYINKGIVEAHKGDIHFKSQYGSWTESGYVLDINKRSL